MSRKASARCKLGYLNTDSFHYLVSKGCKPDYDPKSSKRKDPPFLGVTGTVGNVSSVLYRRYHSGKRSDRVCNVVGTVGKCHGTGRYDHQNSKYFFNIDVVFSFDVFFELDSIDKELTNKRCQHRNTECYIY